MSSEVARFREQQALQEQAAHNALYGPSEVASHESIIARMDLNGPYYLQLIQEGRGDEAIALMENGWTIGE